MGQRYCKRCGRRSKNGHGLCQRCQRIPEATRRGVDAIDEALGLLEQGNISAKNITRLEEFTKLTHPRAAELAVLIIDIARVKSHKRKRWKFLRLNHPELLERAFEAELIERWELGWDEDEECLEPDALLCGDECLQPNKVLDMSWPFPSAGGVEGESALLSAVARHLPPFGWNSNSHHQKTPLRMSPGRRSISRSL